jgi:hypothetical protein
MPSRSSSDAVSDYSRRSSGSATARLPERRSSRDSRGSRGSKDDRSTQRPQSSRRSEGSTRSGGSACSGASRRSSSASTKMRRNQSSPEMPSTSRKGSAPETDRWTEADRWIFPPGTKVVGGYYDHEMPGYGGHRPGVQSGSGYGKSIGKAEKRAALDLAIYKRGEVPDFRPAARWISDDHFCYCRGSTIPGYKGHVPGVVSDNLFAISLCKAAKDNWHAHLDGPRRRKSEWQVRKMLGEPHPVR